MIRYSVRAYPLNFTNDIPTMEKEIVAKKPSAQKIIKDFYGRKADRVVKVSGGYIATAGYVDIKIDVKKLGAAV